jgi:hypothetical protein
MDPATIDCFFEASRFRTFPEYTYGFRLRIPRRSTIGRANRTIPLVESIRNFSTTVLRKIIRMAANELAW